jgi:hypothetical protein
LKSDGQKPAQTNKKAATRILSSNKMTAFKIILRQCVKGAPGGTSSANEKTELLAKRLSEANEDGLLKILADESFEQLRATLTNEKIRKRINKIITSKISDEITQIVVKAFMQLLADPTEYFTGRLRMLLDIDNTKVFNAADKDEETEEDKR